MKNRVYRTHYNNNNYSSDKRFNGNGRQLQRYSKLFIVLYLMYTSESAGSA